MPYDLLSRRELIFDKLYARTLVVDNGFFLNGRPSPCLIWQGPTSGNGRGGGYGRMCLDGHTVAVHIVSFTNEYGFIPGKKQVDHKCNQRLCWNPAHLQLVTHKKNQRLRNKRIKEKMRAQITNISEHEAQCLCEHHEAQGTHTAE